MLSAVKSPQRSSWGVPGLAGAGSEGKGKVMKRSFWCNCILLLVSAGLGPIVLLQAGCGGQQQATDPGAKQVTAQFSAPLPVLYRGEGSPFGVQFLADTNFANFTPEDSQKNAQFTHRWYVEPEAAVAAAVQKVVAVTPEGNEESAVEIAPYGQQVRIQQTTAVLSSAIPPNTLAEATLEGKADAAVALGLVVEGLGDETEFRFGQMHPGGGEWRPMRMLLPLPSGREGLQLRVAAVALPEGRASPVGIRTVSLRLIQCDTPEAVAEALWGAVPNGNLIRNGDFEAFNFSAPPFPWEQTWFTGTQGPGKGGKIVLERHPDAPENTIVSFTSPVDGSLVLRQKVPAPANLPAGTVVTATVEAYAQSQGSLAIMLRAGNAAKEVNRYTFHPGDSSWHNVSVSLSVPEGEKVESFTVDIYRNASSGAVRADNVRLEVGEAANPPTDAG